MKRILSRTLIVITVLITLSYLLPYCLSESYSHSYQLLDKPNGLTQYKLNVVVSQSLYGYYREKSHNLNSNNDFAKFVTPYTLKPVANSLWEIYTDDEDFTNGVLMFVHQIPYVETLPVKYPIETIVENEGDCDLFSYIAASILKAGRLDAVLLYYESEAHMNVGVHLSHTPHDARGQARYITYNSMRYYVAECTGDNWKNGWRVGECSDDLEQASVQVITLENCEQWAPGQVSASYKTLVSSSISLITSSTYVIQGSAITLSGQLSPALQNKTVTVYVKINNSPWTILGIVTTDSNGRFTHVCDAETAGAYYIRASWSGNSDYAGADSSAQNVIVLSIFFIFLLAVTMVLVCVGAVMFFVSRQSRQEVQEPQPPEIPFYARKAFTQEVDT
ncbi:MAG: Ig-like domain-containing protein [Candidatus Bathyarchaeota archaeon]|nr:Ig-like domain-containing protein [Candidatus Bathyarchaeota archaeon]MDH5746497.1 Ig-like domain-containing protein [Candidatus Bathyarchaeota archaeon]